MVTLSPSTHTTLRRATGVLLGLAFLVVLGLVGTRDARQYREAQAILVDAVRVDAAVALLEVVESRGRRGRRRDEFHFGYRFEAGGITHEGRFETSSAGAEPYLKSGVVAVLYSAAVPSRFARVSEVERVASVGAVLKKLALELLVAGGLLFIAYWAITARLFKQGEVPPAAPGSA